MKVVGLCGGSGSGKGTVCSIFSELGIPCIDTDAVYRELTNRVTPCTRELGLEFGDMIFFEDGSLNRRALATIVFNDELKRLRLNEIAHRYILDECRRRISFYDEQNYPVVIIDAPLLFESGFDKECDITICVLADENVRINRIVSRDGISDKQAKSRIASQINDALLVSKCDFVIPNNSDVSSLYAIVKMVADQLLDK